LIGGLLEALQVVGRQKKKSLFPSRKNLKQILRLYYIKISIEKNLKTNFAFIFIYLVNISIDKKPKTSFAFILDQNFHREKTYKFFFIIASIFPNFVCLLHPTVKLS
jgi:hypothetical protein